MASSAASCTCASCVACCKTIPGIFTPVEALRAVRAGRAADMMSVWMWTSGKEHEGWDVLMPLSRSSYIEARWSYRWNLRRRDCALSAAGTCTFLTDKGLCAIHETDFKPAECRQALACGGTNQSPANADLRRAWDTFVGSKVVEIWQRELRATQREDETP